MRDRPHAQRPNRLRTRFARRPEDLERFEDDWRPPKEWSRQKRRRSIAKAAGAVLFAACALVLVGFILKPDRSTVTGDDFGFGAVSPAPENPARAGAPTQGEKRAQKAEKRAQAEQRAEAAQRAEAQRRADAARQSQAERDARTAAQQAAAPAGAKPASGPRPIAIGDPLDANRVGAEMARERLTALARTQPAVERPARPAPEPREATPNPDQALRTAFEELNTARMAARARLARAKTAKPQAAAARDLEHSFRRAATKIGGISAKGADTRYAELIAALTATEAAYADLADAIATGDQRGYDRARHAVLGAEAAMIEAANSLM